QLDGADLGRRPGPAADASAAEDEVLALRLQQRTCTSGWIPGATTARPVERGRRLPVVQTGGDGQAVETYRQPAHRLDPHHVVAVETHDVLRIQGDAMLVDDVVTADVAGQHGP